MHAWHESDGGWVSETKQEVPNSKLAWFRRRHCRLSFFSYCLSSELRVEFCQYSRAFFALSAIHFGIFARCALVRSRTPKILCLSNARSWDLHFGTSFVTLRALVREIIPNTIHTYIHTYLHNLSRISIDCLTPASRLRRSASVWMRTLYSLMTARVVSLCSSEIRSDNTLSGWLSSRTAGGYFCGSWMIMTSVTVD